MKNDEITNRIKNEFDKRANYAKQGNLNYRDMYIDTRYVGSHTTGQTMAILEHCLNLEKGTELFERVWWAIQQEKSVIVDNVVYVFTAYGKHRKGEQDE